MLCVAVPEAAEARLRSDRASPIVVLDSCSRLELDALDQLSISSS